jgi:hypothetical protein
VISLLWVWVDYIQATVLTRVAFGSSAVEKIAELYTILRAFRSIYFLVSEVEVLGLAHSDAGRANGSGKRVRRRHPVFCIMTDGSRSQSFQLRRCFLASEARITTGPSNNFNFTVPFFTTCLQQPWPARNHSSRLHRLLGRFARLPRRQLLGEVWRPLRTFRSQLLTMSPM